MVRTYSLTSCQASTLNPPFQTSLPSKVGCSHSTLTISGATMAPWRHHHALKVSRGLCLRLFSQSATASFKCSKTFGQMTLPGKPPTVLEVTTVLLSPWTVVPCTFQARWCQESVMTSQSLDQEILLLDDGLNRILLATALKSNTLPELRPDTLGHETTDYRFGPSSSMKQELSPSAHSIWTCDAAAHRLAVFIVAVALCGYYYCQLLNPLIIY